MRVVSINREFGSGGRELGYRLAKELNFDYYDRDIISSIAQRSGLDPNFIEESLKKGTWNKAPLFFGNSLTALSVPMSITSELLSTQTKIIREIASLGKDCVIVGRSADTILSDYNPLKIFVYADLPSKLKRCMANLREEEKLTESQMLKKIRNMDADRIKTKEMISGKKWGEKDNYNLMVNTSGCCSIEHIVPSIADYARKWFEISR